MKRVAQIPMSGERHQHEWSSYSDSNKLLLKSIALASQFPVHTKHCEQETGDKDQERPHPKLEMNPIGAHETRNGNPRHRQAAREPSPPFFDDLMCEVLHKEDSTQLRPAQSICWQAASAKSDMLRSCFNLSEDKVATAYVRIGRAPANRTKR